ncbi:MAG: DUF839 domain-containing protein [Bacteroidia bacterium]|nr:DUF839 domain-containing protein [Bacteroidia bacterium]
MNQSRRDFLRTSGAVGLGFMGLYNFVSCSSATNTRSTRISSDTGYGSLIKDPQGILNLPPGFSYQIISKQGQLMSDGLLIPGKADGMATFPLDNNRLILIRNHEIVPTDLSESPFGVNNELLSKLSRDLLYDYGRVKPPDWEAQPL